MKARFAARLLVLVFLLAVPAVLRAGQTVYVVSSDPDAPGEPAVLRIDPTGKASPVPILPAKFVPVGLAVDARGNLYVAADSSVANEARIIKRTLAGEVSVLATIPSSTVEYLAVDARGNAYVADGIAIYKLTPRGKRHLLATVLSGEAGEEHGLACDARGNIYVSTSAPFHNRIVKVTPDGKQSVFAVVPTNVYLAGLAVDARGNLYAAGWNYQRNPEEGGEPLPNRITRYTPAGKGRIFAMLPGSSGLEGIAFDAHGNLYVSSYSKDQVVKISAAGTTVTNLATVSQPTVIAAAPANLPDKPGRSVANPR